MKTEKHTEPPKTKDLMKHDKEHLVELVRDLYEQLDDATASKRFIADLAPPAWEKVLEKAHEKGE